MRIGLISDTHFQNWQAFGQCHENRISKRLLQQRDNFLQAKDIFQKERVDCIIHGGDWVHSVGSVSNEVLNISSEILRGLAVPILLVCGNHDTPVRIPPKEHHIITNILSQFSSMGVEELFQPKNICLINYQDDIDYDKVKGYDLVVVHKTPVGSKLGTYTFNDGVNWRKLAANNKFVAFGHIHQMQKLSDNAFIIGSPMQLGFGDDGKRGVWIVDTETNSCMFRKLDYPEFIVVDDQSQIKDDGNYYKLMGTKTKIDNENVISVVVPEVFKERIKSQDFDGILREWITINKKDDTYLELIKDITEEKLSLVKALFKGRLLKVNINSFLSIGKAEYEIPESGFTLVSGDSDSFSSNGSGKSSMIGESICWCLTGETTKGLTGDDIIMRGKKDATVSLELSPGLTITRSVVNGLEVFQHLPGGIKKNLVEGLTKPKRQDYLESSVLGFGKKLFSASVYFSQENITMLTKMSDTEKTNIITDMLGFEQYDDLKKKIDTKIKTFEEGIADSEKEKIMYEKDFAVNNERLAGLDNGIADKDRQIKEFEEFIEGYKVKIEGLRNQVAKDEEFERVDYDSQIKVVNDNQDTLSNKIEAVRESIDSIQQLYNSNFAQKTTRFIETDALTTEKRKLKKDIDSLKSVKLGVRCDKCGSNVTENNIDIFVKEKEKRIREIEAEVEISEAALDSYENILSDIITKKAHLTTKENIFISDQSKNRLRLVDINNLKSAQDKKEKDILLNKEKAKGEIDKYTSFIKDYSDRVVNLKEERHEMNKERTGIACDVKLLDANIERVADRIEKAKVDIDKLGFWKIAFSPKGIRSVLLDRFCNEINATINRYLSNVSGGTMSIMMTPTKTTKDGDERNKIGMSIQMNGNEVKYESLSGGEKRRVDVSLCFGLNKFISYKYGLDGGLLGLVILDEVFSFLDKSGEESVAELLWHEGKTKSIFVIDHALNLSSFADRIWIVKKNNNISTLEILKQ